MPLRFAFAFAMLWALGAHAQDNNYWSQQFGARSGLMGGAVVGGVRDNSASFYNPGALGFVTNPTLSVTANAIQLNTLDIKDGGGPGYSMSSQQLQFIPLLVSGVKLLKNSPRWVLGYALIQRHQTNFNATVRHDEVLTDVFINTGQQQDYIGQAFYNNAQRETWAGASVAYRLKRGLTNNLSVGISTFIAYRSQTYNFIQSAQAAPLTRAYFAATRGEESVDYTNFRALWKIGLAWEHKKFKLGLAITTPSINITGSATVVRENSSTNLLRSGQLISPTYIDFLATDRQEDLPTTFKSPLSIAFGVEHTLGSKTTVAASVEWFQRINTYSIVSPADKPFVRPSTRPFPLDASDFLRVEYAARSVTNFAFALEQVITSRITGYLSFRSDFSFYEPPTQPARISDLQSTFVLGRSINLSKVNLDLYHVTLGGTLQREKSSLSGGVSYGFGNQTRTTQLANLDNPKDATFLFNTRGTAQSTYASIGVIIGYTYFLK